MKAEDRGYSKKVVVLQVSMLPRFHYDTWLSGHVATVITIVVT
jgi:hypothetical protein